MELEISLDETREQYNNVLRTSNNRAQQKKMAFLERNLEQLTVVQRQLVEQNSQLKKEAAIAERKLATRTERIRNLESLLHDSQEKLTAASHRFVHPFPSTSASAVVTPTSPMSASSGDVSPASTLSSNASADRMLRQRKRSSTLRDLYVDSKRVLGQLVQNDQKWPYRPDSQWEQTEDGLWTRIPDPPTRNFSCPFSKKELADFSKDDKDKSMPSTSSANKPAPSRFEVQLQSVKERLEAAKAGSTRGLGIGGAPGAAGFNFGVGPRIAKPLRGGGGGAEVQQHPGVSSLQAGQPETGNKRSSWFFNQRA